MRFAAALALVTCVLVAGCAGVHNPPAGEPAAATRLPGDVPASIVGVEWEWLSLTTREEKIQVEDPARYTVTLNPDGRVSARLDCNRGTGTYTFDETAKRIDILPLATTRAMCPPESRAGRFAQLLVDASVATLADDGSFVLELPGDAGTLRFRAKSGPR